MVANNRDLRKHCCRVVFSWTICATLAVAQADNPAALLAEAERLYWLDNWIKARPLYAKAEKLFVEQGDTRNAALARISGIRADADRTSYPAATRQLAQELQDPVVAGDPELLLRCLMVKATIDLSIDPPSSAEIWKEALRLAESSDAVRWLPRIQAELGIVAFLNGDGVEARRLMTDAIMAATANGDIAGQIRGLSLIGVGMSELGEYERSLRYFDQALALAGRDPDLRFPLMAHMGKAHSLEVLGRAKESRELLEKAVQFVQSAEMNVYKADVFLAIGEDAFEAKEYATAIKLLTEAIESAQRFEMPRPRAAALLKLSRIYTELKDWERADECATEAIVASRQLVDMYVLPRTLATAAKIKALRGQTADADALYEEAGDLIEGMLVNVPSVRMRSTLVAAMSEVYVGHFLLAAEQLKNPNKAFEILERARGRAAADAVRSPPTPRDQQNKEKALAERRVVDLQIRLQQASTRQERHDLLRELSVAEENLQPNHLEHGRFKQFLRGDPVALQSLQRTLREDEVLVEYLLAEPFSFALVISRQSFRLQRLESGPSIANLAEQFLAEVKSKNGQPRAPGRRLSALLLDPIRELTAKRRAIIVPDGILHLIPFDALPLAGRPLLGDQHIVTIAPSATVLHLIRSSAPAVPRPARILAVGDVSYAPLVAGSQDRSRETRGIFDIDGHAIADLPSTADEIAAVVEQAGASAVTLLGNDATETAFKRAPLASFSVLHLAVHGAADTKFPDRSALVFAADPESVEDGLLQVREIDGLHLDADLVVLSACDTGAGRIQGQEGIANIVRAFLYAGARSVVSTLWEVDDAFTTALMKRFYAKLASGKPADEALHEAKAEMRQRLGPNGVPYFWGPFTVVGDGLTTIQFSRN